MPYYPEREVFDYAVFDPGRYGALHGAVLNCYTNTPSYGDERAFFDARCATASSGAYFDPLFLGAAIPQEVVLRIYVNNGGNDDLIETSDGWAQNVTARIALPSASATSLRARAYLSLSNPQAGWPGVIEDTVDIVADQPLVLEPVPGSALVLRDSDVRVPMSDGIFDDGAILGGDAMKGLLPPGFKYACLIQARARVTPA